VELTEAIAQRQAKAMQKTQTSSLPIKAFAFTYDFFTVCRCEAWSWRTQRGNPSQSSAVMDCRASLAVMGMLDP